MGPSLIRICYISRSALPAEADAAAEIARILESSRSRNAQVGITGALFFSDGLFAQVLEGPAAHVDGTFERIRADPRHCSVVRVEWQAIEVRSFADWAMSYVGDDLITAMPALRPFVPPDSRLVQNRIVSMMLDLLARKGGASAELRTMIQH